MRRFAILCLLAFVLAWTASAGAQTLTGTITGKVTDESGGVLPGVTVTLLSAQGAQTQVTDAKGEFRFIGLQPATYTVKSELSGFRPKEQAGLTLGIGKTIDVTLAMAVGGVTEQVDVVANAVVIDTTSTATDTNLSKDLLFTAPMSHTQAHNLLNYAPGINNSSAFGGASDSANSLNIDGVDTRDPSGGTPWMFFNFNLIDEVQVGGIGQPAEYGGFTGAVVNSITKSGGNRFAFMTEMRYTNDKLSGNNTTDQLKAVNPGLAQAAVVNKMTDYSVQLGGPIARDKVFFFGSAQRYSQRDNPTGPRTIHTEISPRFNFKVTAQPTRNDQLTYSMQYDQYNQTGRTGKVPEAYATDKQTRTEDAPNTMWNLQYRKIFGSTTFFEAKYTGYSGYYDLNPVDMSPYHFDGETGVYSGGAGYVSKHDRGRNQVNLSLSKYSEFHGSHNFKFGMEIERSTTRDRFEYAGGLYFYDYGGPYMAYNYSYDMQAKNKRESFYGQDTWKFGRFSANLGIRADRIRGDDKYKGQLYSTFSVAPRLGLVYDLSGKGTSVVRGFYGQLYDGATQLAWWQAGGGITDLYEWEVGPGWQIIEPPYDIIPAASKYTVGKDLKHPRTDEFSVAWEQQLRGNMKFSATGIYRNSKNFINSVLTNALWTPFTCSTSSGCIPSATPPWTGSALTMYKWANKGDPKFLIQNVDTVTYNMSDGSTITSDQSRKYKGLMLVFTKSMSNRWNAQISYVLSKTDGNISNSSGSGVSSSQFETPNGIIATVNGEQIAYGYAGYDRRHEFKLFGGYQIPVIETRLDAYFYAVSGFNYTPYASINKKYTNWTGTISQNLETRGSRQVQTEKNLTLRIEKVFNYQIHRFGIYADINNLFNWGVVTGVVTRITGSSILGQTVPFETPTALIPARQATFGVRWSF